MGLIETPGAEAVDVKANEEMTKKMDGPKIDMGGFSEEELDILPLKKFFDIDTINTDDDRYLKGIMEWARSQNIGTKEDLFLKLREVELKLGSQVLGERRLPRLYRYLRLNNELNRTLKEIKAYER